MTDAIPKERASILVVEDEVAIRDGVSDVLAFHGHSPTAVATGEEGLHAGRAGNFDLAILDVMLPGLNGFDLCEQLRRHAPLLPILMLTAKGSEDDIVEGLQRGADDYMTKPFSIRELVARVEALLRRRRLAEPKPTSFDVGGWRIDVARLRATSGQAVVELTVREVRILELLVRERGRIVSRRTLLREAWDKNHPEALETRTVDVHIAKLRKKLVGRGLSGNGRRSLTGRDQDPIETVRGAGYRSVG